MRKAFKFALLIIVIYITLVSVCYGLTMIIFDIFNLDDDTVSVTSTPTPTSNIECRLHQLEQQLADSISKQQKLQQGIDRVENQYKNWARPFEDWFSATQAAYLKQYRKRNGGEGYGE